MKAKDLKNSILQMAVEGKLVPQDPADEPASVLLERIREERRKLVAEKKIKTPKGGESIIYLASDGSRYEKFVDAKGRESEPVCIDDEIPFYVPEGWEWARLENLASVITDGDHQAPPQVNDGIPFLVISDVSNGQLSFNGTRHVPKSYYDAIDANRKPQAGDLLITVTGSFGITVPVDTENAFCFQRHIALIRPLMFREYLDLALSAPFAYERFNLESTGTAQKTVSLTVLRQTLIPLPPLAEQRRIAGRVAELMPLVEEYGRLEGEREALDASLPERLRKSILQEAVRGRLVSQDPADEPASALLERIRAERAAKVASGELKAPKGGESTIYVGSDGAHYEKFVDAKGRESTPVCIDKEIPFEVPDGWEWARLGSLCAFGKCHNIEYRDVPDGTWMLELDDIERDNGRITVKRRKSGGSGSTKHSFEAGDVLYSKLRPYLNKVILADEDGMATSEILPLQFDELNARYMQLFLMAPPFVDYAKSCSYGVKMPRLGTNDGAKALVPLPPLSEQCRIAERVDELLALLA